MALTNYNRATDETHLVRDINVEVLELFYAPYVEDEGDLSIGDGDPAKAGAIASVLTGGEVKLAVYQGDGTWKIVGGSSAPSSVLTVSESPTLDWSTDEAPDENGAPSGQTYAQRFGNTPHIQVWLETSTDNYSLETVPITIEFSGTDIETVNIDTSDIAARIIIK